MAVFGAPVAHGDDPLRAVRAALDIHQRMATVSAANAVFRRHSRKLSRCADDKRHPAVT
jgi:hypothetical protein